MIFKKGVQILHGNSRYGCIVADRQLAVFGKMSKIKGGARTSFQHTKIVGNMKSTISDFEYSLIKN